jgi:hypothetical protein
MVESVTQAVRVTGFRVGVEIGRDVLVGGTTVGWAVAVGAVVQAESRITNRVKRSNDFIAQIFLEF